MNSLKFHIGHDELHDHLLDKADFHRMRAAWYQSQVEMLGEAEIDPNMQTVGSNAPLFRTKRTEHLTKAATFAFLADHMLDGDYEVGPYELQQLELIERF